ncbi:OmpA family protein [Pseudomonas sp. ML96]|uniref:OmpA family protein n=1 Tax=Pseudomonas sp. ML96 TaxID=1523503 RepID=UPI0005B94BD4|nr:OmpA family protein [Pseudomonas sp. ML96]
MRGNRKGAEHEVIIKRRGRKNHHEEHGGAWKVAFADFTMAMMALFMVLWVIQPQMKMENPSYGDEQSNPLLDGGAGVFDSANTRPIEFEGSHTRKDFDTQKDATQTALLGKPQQSDAAAAPAETGQPSAARRYNSSEDLKELAALVREVSGQVDALANIEVEVVPQGLRILIKDDQQRFMFARGSAKLDPHFHKLLGALSGVLAKVDNKLIISGHTDAVPYRGSAGYNNWNLSGDRALRARNVLVKTGLPPLHVLQVAAQADVMPLRPEDPENGANRRIELLLLTSRAETLYRDLFGEGYAAQVHYSQQGARFVEGQQKAAADGEAEKGKL